MPWLGVNQVCSIVLAYLTDALSLCYREQLGKFLALEDRDGDLEPIIDGLLLPADISSLIPGRSLQESGRRSMVWVTR